MNQLYKSSRRTYMLTDILHWQCISNVKHLTFGKYYNIKVIQHWRKYEFVLDDGRKVEIDNERLRHFFHEGTEIVI